MIRHTYLALACAVLPCALILGCHNAPPPRAMPPSLGLDAAATYDTYLRQRPTQGKLRHQVESAFGPRKEALQGIFVFRAPEHFLVRAQSAFGPSLFDVKHAPNAPLDVTVHLDALRDERFARYLARDIRRIYFQDCPAAPTTSIERQQRDIIVACALPAEASPIAGDRGADDRVVTQLSLGGVPVQKTFRRGESVTAVVTYDDYREVQGHWLAHRVTLTGHDAPYSLTIVLTDADLAFDTSRVFASAPAASAP